MNMPRWLVLSLLALPPAICPAQEDVADVPSHKRQAGDDERKSYFLIPPATDTKPSQGFGLLIILPGGDGGEAFHPFVKRIRKNAVPEDSAVAQPIAFKWSPEQAIVWPTEKLAVEKQEFSTEEFVEAVIKDVATTHSLDARRIFCMGWSSSGPAVYALALQDKPVVNGSYVAMSVFKPQQLPPLAKAKGRSIYIEHSQQDRICPYWMAQQGYQQLKGEGARTTLVTYEGGHGWRGDVYGRIRRALQWLQKPSNGD
jgi:predicted esterase